MATICDVTFTVSWTSSYSAALTGGNGALTTRAGHAARFNAPGADFGLPWSVAEKGPRWSRFWSSYLGSPGALRNLGPDSAWEHVVPFQVWHRSDLTAPADTTARSRVLVYPSAISVIVSVRASGAWPIDELGAWLDYLHTKAVWGEPTTAVRNRTLRGIATDLRDQAASRLFDAGQPLAEPDTEVERTVAAPIQGRGEPTSFELTDPTVCSCLAGMAALGPPGNFIQAKLLDPNSSSNRASRMYVLKEGHAVWNPTWLLRPPDRDSLVCLVHNQTDLVAHVEAVGSIVDWAANQVTAAAQIPIAVQPLIRVAADRLRTLYSGNSRSTYRSGLAMARIEPLLGQIDTIRNAL